eukprot:546792-Pleurochrysis_carterae.AAC.3
MLFLCQSQSHTPSDSLTSLSLSPCVSNSVPAAKFPPSLPKSCMHCTLDRRFADAVNQAKSEQYLAPAPQSRAAVLPSSPPVDCARAIAYVSRQQHMPAERRTAQKSARQIVQIAPSSRLASERATMRKRQMSVEALGSRGQRSARASAVARASGAYGPRERR